jgi:sigma-B regulation protein RsbU (phosphoserine phosphatase)
VLTTDGILESRSGDEFFGRVRLKQVIRENSELSAGDLIQAVHRQVLEFTGGAPADDDLTMVILRALE